MKQINSLHKQKLQQEAHAAVAEIADRTAYDALINDHLDNNILPCSYFVAT